MKTKTNIKSKPKKELYNHNTELISAFSEFASSKNVDKPTIIRIVSDVFKTIIKNQFGDNQNFEIVVNIEKGDLEIFRVRTIVSDYYREDSFDYDANKHISISEIVDSSDFEIGEEYAEQIEISSFSRRVNVKQCLYQKVRELDNHLIFEEYTSRIGEIVVAEMIGINYHSKDIILNDNDGNELILPRKNQITYEYYKKGNSVKALLTDVISKNGKTEIILSRTSPLFLERILESEIDEIDEGVIGIKYLAREAGDKSKIVVESFNEKIDPVGVIVGNKGSRINSISKELNNERLDIIKYTDNYHLLITRLLAPAKISNINIVDDKISVYLDADQMGLAIGKNGINLNLTRTILNNKQIDLYRNVIVEEEDDVYLSEFSDEISTEILEKLREKGLDTAKQVLSYDKTDLLKIIQNDIILENILTVLFNEFNK